MDALQRAKYKLDKEKAELRLEADDLVASVEQLSRSKVRAGSVERRYVTPQLP